MRCDDIQILLLQLGSNIQAPAAKEHLSICRTCRKAATELAQVWDQLGVLPEIKPSPAFRAQFWEKAREQESNWLSWPRLVPAFAGFFGMWALGVGFGAAIYLHSPTPSERVQWTPSKAMIADVYLQRMGTL